MRKFKCIKSYESGEWLTRGKIYTEDNGKFRYDDGWIDTTFDYDTAHFDSDNKVSEYLEEIKEDKKMGKFIKPKLDNDTMIEKLNEYCYERNCDDCVFQRKDDEFDTMSDEQLLESYNLAFVTSKTFTITTSDTITTLTDGTHTTSINRYHTDKHNDIVALEEVVKKYKSEMEEIEHKSKEIHLMSGKTDYGVIGTPTILVDSIGRKLSVGDVVKVYDENGEYIGTEFVCNCSPYGDFIMGCAIATMNNSKKEFNYLKEFSYEETVEKSLSFSGLEVIK